ncbi:MAG: hypothetical protein IPM02_17850 [Betaproteobacteria bacterium]|nr:hypothetical protein [Betaproteobacteria bacterium]
MRVRGDGLALRVPLRRAVGIELHQPDREQLHDFARVVFVRLEARGRVLLVITQHVEVVTHRRMQRQVLEQRPVIAEGVAVEHVHPRRQRPGVLVRRDIGHDHDLGERERDPRAQLVFVEQELLPDCLVRVLLVDAVTAVPDRLQIVDMRRPRGYRILRVEPRAVAVLRQRVDLGHGLRAERRLREEARRVAGAAPWTPAAAANAWNAGPSYAKIGCDWTMAFFSASEMV